MSTLRLTQPSGRGCSPDGEVISTLLQAGGRVPAAPNTTPGLTMPGLRLRAGPYDFAGVMPWGWIRLYCSSFPACSPGY